MRGDRAKARCLLGMLAVAIGLVTGAGKVGAEPPRVWVGSAGTVVARTHANYTPICDGDLCLPGNVEFFIRWRVGVLLDEPVVYCDAAWALSYVRNVIGSRTVPEEVLGRIRIFNVRYQGVAESEGPAYRAESSQGFECDLGILGAPVASIHDVAKWPKEKQGPAFSLQVPESPAWSHLFFWRCLGCNKEFWPEAKAKAAMGRRFTLVNRALEITAIQYDLSPVRAWMAEQEAQVVAKTRAAHEQREQALAREREKREQAPGKDFWSQPESSETRQEQARRIAGEKEIVRLEAEVHRKRAEAEASRRRYQDWENGERQRQANVVKPGPAKEYRRAMDEVLRFFSQHLAHVPGSEGAYDAWSLREVAPCRIDVQVTGTRWWHDPGDVLVLTTIRNGKSHTPPRRPPRRELRSFHEAWTLNLPHDAQAITAYDTGTFGVQIVGKPYGGIKGSTAGASALPLKQALDAAIAACRKQPW